MAVKSGASIVTDSLVFAYDTNNQFRSYLGPVVSNVVGDRTLGGGNWAKSYTENNNLDDPIDKPPGVTQKVVSFTNSDANGGAHPTSACFWFNYSDDTPQDPSTTYSISLWIRTKGQNIQARAYTANNEETGRQNTEDVIVPGDDKWHRVEWNPITTPADTQSDSLSFRFYDNIYPPEGQTIYLCAPQMTPTSYHIPFVDGSLTTSTSLKDWTGNRTITRNGTITDNSDFTFDLDGSSAYMQMSPIFNPYNSSYSLEAWIKRDATGRNDGIMSDLQYNWLNFWVSSSNKLSWKHGYYNEVPAETRNELIGVSDVGTDWTHVAVTFENGVGAKLYINGVLDNSNSNGNPFGLTGSRGVQFIGTIYNNVPSGTNGLEFDGQIAIARGYSRALTAGEVRMNFLAYRKRFGV